MVEAPIAATDGCSAAGGRADVPDVSLLEFIDLGLQAALDVAQLVDARGFRRFWFAQHIDTDFFLNPVILSTVVAGLTERVRVGTAGVLLRYFSPREVAADAMTLDGLFPGRVDPGLAAGFASAAVAEVLADGRIGYQSDAYFDDKVRGVRAALERCTAAQGTPTTAAATPSGETSPTDGPQPWLLGSGGKRACFAGENGLCYCLSLFHNSRSAPDPEIVDRYRESFVASPFVRAPQCSILLSLLCADTQAAADTLAQGVDKSYPFVAVGADSAGQVLCDVADRYRVDEVVIREVSPNLDARKRSLALIAESLARARSGSAATKPPSSTALRPEGGEREGWGAAAMADFPRTRRFLARQRLGKNAGILLAIALLFGGWTVWMSIGTVTLHVASASARLEVDRLPVAVQAPVDGQVATADLRLGRVLRRGEPILTLDARHLELQRAAIQVALRTSATSLAALRAQLGAEQAAHDAVIRVARSASEAARARVALDEKSLSFRERELSMVERLHGVAALSALDALHVAEGTEAQRAKLATTSAEAATDAGDGMANVLDRVVRIATVQYSVAQAEADAEKLKAQVEILDHEIERRTVLAPVSGALADVLPLSAGATVTPQQRLATIVPDGSVRAVAFFAPDESLGRLRAGQAVTIRLDNFPWTQYGTLAGVVDQVGREPRDAKVRVEIRIAGRNAAIPLEHGLTAVCEVAVERISPFKLLLRSAGHWLEASVEPPATTGASSSRTAGL